MNLGLLKSIPRENVKQWTKLTTYCYNIGCTCRNCDYFPEYYKRQCMVKLQVLLLCRNLGKPKEQDESENNRK